MSGESDDTIRPWFQTRIIRNRLFITHDSPYERKFVEEIQLINNSISDVRDFPLPLTEFKHGLEVFDDDGSILSFYPRSELDAVITTLERTLYEQIERQLEEQYLLWIRFPDNKPIRPNELRIVRLVYPSPEDHINVKKSIFDIPSYVETIGKTSFPSETFYFIKSPKDFVIEIDRGKTEVKDETTNEYIAIKYLDTTSSSTDFKGDLPHIKNRECHVSARFPARNNTYKTLLHYKIKLPKLERWIWRTVLPITGIFLLTLIIAKLIYPNTEYLAQNILLAIGGSTITIAAALIALMNNPLVRRTRVFLFIHIALSIILILNSGLIQLVPVVEV